MRISELARQSGLPVATIKFYLREGLLPPGAPISRTQAEYDDAHLERLRLIKALRDIADLSVATVGTVLAAVDDEEVPLLDLLGVTQTAVAVSKVPASASQAGVELAARLLDDLGWTLTRSLRWWIRWPGCWTCCRARGSRWTPRACGRGRRPPERSPRWRWTTSRWRAARRGRPHRCGRHGDLRGAAGPAAAGGAGGCQPGAVRPAGPAGGRTRRGRPGPGEAGYHEASPQRSPRRRAAAVPGVMSSIHTRRPGWCWR